MILEDLIKLVVDNGISVICVCYMIFYQHTTMTKMLDTLTAITDRLTRIEVKMEEHSHENQQTVK